MKRKTSIIAKLINGSLIPLTILFMVAMIYLNQYMSLKRTLESGWIIEDKANCDCDVVPDSFAYYMTTEEEQMRELLEASEGWFEE